MIAIKYSILPLLAIALFPACQTPEGPANFANFANLQIPSEFAEYWYRGEAELSSYQLNINRYGEERQGDAVLIFVTEDLSKTKQVKLDQPGQAGNDKVSVLKLNNVWKFKTGIYDYSLMSSVFTPVDVQKEGKSLKSTFSAQDWCGHSFQQINLRKKDYQLQLNSYFESEGDATRTFRADLLEEELMNRLRIDPGSIPQGEVDLIPSAFFSRLLHVEQKPRRARIQFEESEATTQCIVEYLHLNRTVRINFETTFPHRILSWSEENNGQVMVEAKLKQTLKSPYWSQHDNDDIGLRDSLLLSY